MVGIPSARRTTVVVALISTALLLVFKALPPPSSRGPAVAGQRIKVTPAVLDLGCISIESTPLSLPKVVTITNTAGRFLALDKPRSSCACAVAGIGPTTLPPGQCTWLDLQIGPSALGPRKSTISVECRQSPKQLIEIPVKYELTESVRPHPPRLELILTADQTELQTTVSLSARDTTISFKNLEISSPQDSCLVGRVLNTHVHKDTSGQTLAEIALKLEVHGPIREANRELRISWLRGSKTIPMHIICKRDYNLTPSQVILIPTPVNQTTSESIQISRSDGRPFAIDAITNSVPGLLVSAPLEVSAATRRFRLEFTPLRKGIVNGQVRFVANPHEKWPIVLEFHALVTQPSPRTERSQ